MTATPPVRPHSPPVSLGGKVVAAGAATRAALAQALGIAGARSPYRVEAVAWIDHALEVSIGVGSRQPAVLLIEARTAESKGLVLTDHLNVYFRGTALPRPLVSRVSTYAARNLADWTLDRITQLLSEDPELGAAGAAMPPAADDSQRPQSLLDTWGAGDSYADFFATGEIARSQLDSIFSSKLFRYVQHCDAECLQVNPHNVIPTVTLVNFPWDDRLRRPFGPVPQEAGGDADAMVTTDLTEDDVIFGNPDKLRRVLDYAVSRPDPAELAIFFSNTCVPAVIGDDVESLVRQVQKRSGRRIFYLTVTPRSMTTVFEDLLVKRRLAAEKNAGPAQPNAINLIGFPASRAVDELAALLELADITVNVRLLPEILTESVDRLPQAALNVVCENRTWKHLVDQLTFESRTPYVTLGAPFGFERTRAWLRDIAEALSHEAHLERAWREHVSGQQAAWESLRARASSRRVGLVVREAETYFLTTPGVTWGVPLLGVLEEMGFGVDILMKVDDKKTANENARQLRDAFTHPDRHTVRAFDSFAFLRHRLRKSTSDAFLSYQFFDWRLSEAGKAAFSLQHFEMGAPGAVRTLERLLGVCGTEFYRRYGKYLARSTEGLRLDPPTETAEEGSA